MTNAKPKMKKPDAEGIAIHPAMSVDGLSSRYNAMVKMIHATGKVPLEQLLLPIFHIHAVHVAADLDTAAKRLPYLMVLLLTGMTNDEVLDAQLENRVLDLDQEIQRLHAQGLNARSVLNKLKSKS